MKQLENSHTIVIVARQHGSASAFLPLYKRFRDSNFAVKTFAFADAHRLFTFNQIDAKLIDAFDDSLLNDVNGASFMLTGTSELATEDNLFWLWAKDAKIPSCAFVDSWVSYWQRFTPSSLFQKRFTCTPDRIAVIDQFMFHRMVESGCDQRLLIITGNPAFDALANYIPKQKNQIQRKYGDHYFVFIGEPFNNAVFGRQEKDTFGYTEAEVLTLSIISLELIENTMFKLVFLPHPRGGHSLETESIIHHYSRIVLDNREFNSRDLVSCSKGVIGMRSMLLVEAFLMGTPVVSIQPNFKLSSDLLAHSFNIPVVRSSTPNLICTELKNIFKRTSKQPLIKRSTLFDFIFSQINTQLP